MITDFLKIFAADVHGRPLAMHAGVNRCGQPINTIVKSIDLLWIRDDDGDDYDGSRCYRKSRRHMAA